MALEMKAASSQAQSQPGRALVTGASGFIGQALLKQLLQEGYEAHALLRPSSQPPPGLPGSAVIHQASLEDAQALSQACAGIDTVFHLAAYAHVNRASQAEVFQVNVEGSRRLMEAALQAKVRRIVYFSSSLAELRDGQADTVYGQSKRAAEALLLQAAREGRIEVCCLRPVSVYGPGMKGNLMSMVRAIQRGVFPPLPRMDSRVSLVGVDDLCQAALLAARHEAANGQIYTVTDGISYSMRELEQGIRQALGRHQPRWSVPQWLMYIAALKLEVAGRLLRLPNLPGLRAYHVLTSDQLRSCEKISHELGYNPRATFLTTLPSILESMEAGSG